MANAFLEGIGRFAREQFTPNSPTPSPGAQQTHGVHMCMIVDDIDEQNMGRCWVYCPGVSAPNPNLQVARYSPTRNPPNANGTPGTPIESMRQGFILASLLTPHAGSDRLSEQSNTPDGRNPGQGQSNGYGMFAQPRNGNQVAVTFMNGDPSRAYIMGHVPPTAETDMVPSYGPQQTTNATGAGYSTNVGPAYNVGTATTLVASSTIFNNETDAGRNQDSLRGPGCSSSTRETPSRVCGWKTPSYPATNAMGH